MVTISNRQIEKSIKRIEDSIEDTIWEIKELHNKLNLADEVISFLLDLSNREDCPEDVIVQANDLFMRI